MFDDTLLLVNSNHFEQDELGGVDFYLLNNIEFGYNTSSYANYTYVNSHEKTIQLSFFYAEELESKEDYKNSIEFLSTILEPGEIFNSKFLENEEIYMFVFDGSGRKVDFEMILINY